MPPKKTETKAEGATKKSTPSYQAMITDAIVNLKDRNGSSRQSLKKYVRANNDITVADKMFDSLFNKALKTGVEKGIFEQPKGASGGTKLAKKAPPKKEAKEKKPAVKKEAAKKEPKEKKAAAPKKAAAKKETTKKEPKEKKAAAPKKAAPKKETKKAPAVVDKPTVLTKTKSGRVAKTKAAPKKAATAKKPAAKKEKAPKKADKPAEAASA